jgi:hypothetical protein
MTYQSWIKAGKARDEASLADALDTPLSGLDAYSGLRDEWTGEGWRDHKRSAKASFHAAAAAFGVPFATDKSEG